MKRSLTLLAIAACGLGHTAIAQQSAPTGQWQCQTSYTEKSPRGQRTSGFTSEFVMNVQQNGQVYAQGMLNAVPYPTQFQAQAQWKMQDGGFIAQGMQSSPMGPSPWVFFGMVKGQTIEMNHQSKVANGSLGHSINMCRRVG